MKLTIILLFLLAAVTFSCRQSEMVDTPGALRTQSPSAVPFAVGGHAHKFPLDSAFGLMANLSRTPVLSDLTARYGWGGSFPVSAFRVGSANQGVLLWYCFQGGANPRFFLALEQLKSYDPANMPKQPSGDLLVVPTGTFKNPFTKASDPAAFSEFIARPQPDPAGWQFLGADVVNRYIKSADSLFRQRTDGSGDRYNYYPFGFFSVLHESDFNSFLDKAGKDGFVRYYFGYDEKDRPNRLRIILLTADGTGRASLSLRTAGDPGAMQKSWPPPPFN